VITGVVLAAGTSSRFGRTKQLIDFAGKPLVQHAVDAAGDAGCDEVVVVLGHDAERVAAALHLPDIARTIENERYLEGQSTSLAIGLAAADAASEAAIVLPGDQPGVSPDHLRALIARFMQTRARVVRLAYRNGPGPTLLSREIWEQASHLHGDTGARTLIASHPDWVIELTVDEEGPPDIDTIQDLERLSSS